MSDYAFTPNQTDMDKKKEPKNSINVNDLFSGTKEKKK